MSEITRLTYSPAPYLRRKTRVVWVGQTAIGGDYPIRVQSMCTADTCDTEGVLREIRQMVAAGCEIVRLTVPTQEDCDNLPHIRAAMKSEGIKVPLVADIHFTPSIALKCVEFVEKVRINPGNFVDKKLFKTRDYTDVEYAEELTRIREKFTPLVLKCKEYGRAMRIGTNHGSLSDRIMNRYGDTPEGMVESAMEFVRICEDNGFRDIILSMKASNVQVMIAAYRLLAHKLAEVGRDYPFHLGVTEAGEGEDGRVKSAIGIGSLLEDGIGDTVRVSLTEDPVHEVPVAHKLVARYNALNVQNMGFPLQDIDLYAEAPSVYQRRATREVTTGGLMQGATEPIRVWMPAYDIPTFLTEYAAYVKTPQAVDMPVEGVEVFSGQIDELLEGLKDLPLKPAVALRVTQLEVAIPKEVSKVVVPVQADEDFSMLAPLLASVRSSGQALEWNFGNSFAQVEDMAQAVLELTELSAGIQDVLFSVSSSEPINATRSLAMVLSSREIDAPLHLRYTPQNGDNILLASSIALGSLLCDGIGDSVQLDAPMAVKDHTPLAYNILQGCRLRVTKTEYISCPSCGRTQFDLQTTTDRIRERTVHLKGVKIAVMGCIVNGPGEMADADFGYVGTGPKKVSLYVGKDCVQRNLPEEDAVESLVALIKQHGRWVDVPEVA
jgi:(E)-4-hydroxy-3-methylbut-2-enyl-diphosphate synthase